MSIINDDNNVLFPVPEQPENNTHSLDLTKAAYPTLRKQILKGITLGFIKDKEYDRWVYDS